MYKFNFADFECSVLYVTLQSVIDLRYALQSMTSSDPEIVHPGLLIIYFQIQGCDVIGRLGQLMQVNLALTNKMFILA